MRSARRQRLLEHILRLRRAERQLPGEELDLVRSELEQDLGETVSRNLAAGFLGVSHTALNRWVERGDLPTVYTPNGRQEVPVSLLLEIRELLDERERAGLPRLHKLEPLMREAGERARSMRPGRTMTKLGKREPDPHELSHLRSLAYHRAVARKLRRPMVDEARHRIGRWEREGKIDQRYADWWKRILSEPVSEIRKLVSADTQDARDLRQNSPFAGALSEAERRRVLEKVR